MKYSKLILFFALAVLVCFSSCKKEEISEMEEVEINTGTEPQEPEVVNNNVLVSQMQVSSMMTTGLDLGCFSISFPFDLIIDGTTTFTINDESDFENLPMDTVVYIDFAYPVTITYPDGTTDSAADGEALGEAFASCIPDSGWEEDIFPAFLITELNSCYAVAYPVSLTDGSGTTVVANDEDEFVDLIANNYELYFQFPLNLIDEDGNPVSAADDEELFMLLASCDNVTPPGGDTTIQDPIGECWDFLYPFDMTDQDGNIVTINNHDDICNAMLNGLILDYVFPLTLVNGDGEELVVNNMDELNGAWLDCIIISGPVDLNLGSFLQNSDLIEGLECYSVNYPLAYTNTQTGETNTIENAAAAQVYIDGGSDFFEIVDFPVTVTLVETGEQVTIESFEGYFELLFLCQ